MECRMPLLAVAAFLFLCGSAAAQEGVDKCQCLCMADQDDDGNGGKTSRQLYLVTEPTICSVFNEKSCEVKNPGTGQVSYGNTVMCEPLGGKKYLEIKSPPK
jgi:hypothetical protein